MVIRPHDSIFQRIVAGKLKLKPHHFLPRKTRLGEIKPEFPEGRTERLRTKLLAVGIDPVSVGLPPAKPPAINKFVPHEVTYADACREIK